MEGLQYHVARGERLEALDKLAQRIANRIEDGVEPKYLSALAGRLQAILLEIDQIKKEEAGGETNPLDELLEKRRKRQAAGEV